MGLDGFLRHGCIDFEGFLVVGGFIGSLASERNFVTAILALPKTPRHHGDADVELGRVGNRLGKGDNIEWHGDADDPVFVHAATDPKKLEGCFSHCVT